MLLTFTCWTILVSISSCITHWHVTESGRIESKEDSPYTLLRPYDLAAFIKQMHRLERLDILKEVISSKEISKNSEILVSKNDAQSVDTYQEKFYKTDSDCLKASQQLSKFKFFETNHINWGEERFSFSQEILNIKKSDIITFKKPFCDNIELGFRLDKSFDHLNSIQSHLNITMLPELELAQNLLIKPEDYFGHLVYKSLLLNSSSWIYLTMASEFFRIKGDYSNSINCYKRALYNVPKKYALVPLLSFSNMLHKLHFINDSLSVAIAGVSTNSEDFLLSYYLGNIYVTLGELNEAHFWYEKASNIDPLFRNSLLKKHATSCHIKLEQYLEEQHSNLQKRLEELKDYQAYSDEWFQLSSKIELEKSSKDRRDFTKKVYNEFINNLQCTICDWNSNNENFKLECDNFPIHYSSFPLYNQTLTLKEFNSFYEFLVKSSQNVEYNTCMNFEECQSFTQEQNLSNSPTQKQTGDKSINNINDNESPKKYLKSHLLNERYIKNRFEPPSSL